LLSMGPGWTYERRRDPDRSKKKNTKNKRDPWGNGSGMDGNAGGPRKKKDYQETGNRAVLKKNPKEGKIKG